MTKSQAEILASIAALPDGERRSLVAQLVATHMDAPSFLDRLNENERAELTEGIAQAERGEVISADELKGRIAQRFGFAVR